MARQILLMNKEKLVARFDETTLFGNPHYAMAEQPDSYLPYGFKDMDTWLDNRPIGKHREHIRELMRQCGCDTIRGYIDIMHATSLNDTFWVKDAESDLQWSDVSLYSNEFDDAIARAAFDGNGLHGIQFSTTGLSGDLETSGQFPKCWVRESGATYLLKSGTEHFANAGMEPYSEKFMSDLLDFTDYPHVTYTLVQFHGKLASKCRLFTDENTGYVPMAAYLIARNSTGNLSDVLEVIKELEFESEFYHMLAMDAVCVNTDRHLGNFGFLADNDTGEIKSFAPMFDHNMSLLPRIMKQDDWRETILKECDTAFGTDFIVTAKECLNRYPDIQKDLIRLKAFSFTDPGHGCPQWRTDMVNRIKDFQIERILNTD